MSDTDIYKSNERRDLVQPENPKFHRRRRRKRSSEGDQLTFDDPRREKHVSGKRRSSNSGLRRMRHTMKKPHNQKRFYWIIGVSTVVILIGLALWQYWLRDLTITQELPVEPVPETTSE